MTDMTIEQVRNILRHWPTRTIDNMSLHESRELADAIDAHLAKAEDYERAVTEQAMLTECVSVTGRDPSDVIRDVIQWHVSNAAQSVEAVDMTTFEVTLAEGSPEFINGYLLGESPGESGFWLFHPNGRNYNGPFDDREEALMVARRLEPAVLAHPRPMGDEAVSLDEVSADIDALIARVEQGTLSRADVVSLVRRKIGPSWQDRSAPTGEQAGEVDGFTSEDVSNLHSLCRVLENFSKKRAPDPRDLDAEYFVTANINHAVKSATYWLPIVKGIYMRLYGALAEKARRADNEDTQPRPVGVPEGYRLVPVEPTDDMCRNAREKIGIGSNVAHHVWHWMIAAAPDGEVG